jgi:16S rRNA (uracil1498-N3)-methyltransferase
MDAWGANSSHRFPNFTTHARLGRVIRLHLSEPLAAGAEIVLGPEQTHYLVNVMRQAVGDELALFNGRDGEWRGLIVDSKKKACRLRAVEQTLPQETPPDLELIIAAVKRARLETIVEKAAELGARRVRIVLTQRTNADKVRFERLTAIATEAAEQTGRLDVPDIAELVKLNVLLDGWEASRRLLFCDEGGEARPVIEALAGASGPWAILIGPEGGFSPEERQRLRALPFVTPATLGPRILRADTAAISAMTLWQAAAGDWRV